MQFSESDRLLIDRYLDGNLSGQELQQFMDRLESSDEFRRQVSLQNLLVDGIRLSAEQDFRKRLVESLPYRKRRVPVTLWMIIVFLGIVFGSILIWNYTGTGPGIPAREFLTFKWLNHSKSDDEQEKPGTEEKKNSRTNAVTDSLNSEEISDNNTQEEDENNLVSTQEYEAQDESQSDENDSLSFKSILDPSREIVIRKDKMLASRITPIQVKSQSNQQKQDKNGSLSRDVTMKLSPDAGLPPVEEEVVPVLMVEFWQSPVNYRGYKLSRQKLILYGLDEEIGISLLRQDDQLFMRYLNDIYLLRNSQDFIPYKRLKDSEIPNNLINQ